MDKIVKPFKLRLKEALDYRELRPVDLCNKTKISQSTMSQYLSGYAEPKKQRLSLIADALNVNPTWLMGLDVPMEKEVFDQQWDKETTQFEDSISAFYYQLRSLGWKYDWIDSEHVYILTNGVTSVKITPDEYSAFIEESKNFCRKKLQKLLLRSSSLALNAAHARTDIEIPEGVDTSDDDIMDDENF